MSASGYCSFHEIAVTAKDCVGGFRPKESEKLDSDRIVPPGLEQHCLLPDGGVKLAAGWLIDQCGLKGYRQGSFGVHDRQALVLVHFGGGTLEGLLAFADQIVEVVHARFEVTLEREPRWVGERSAG